MDIIMTGKKKSPTKGQLLAKDIIEKYQPKTVEDMQNALKNIFGPMFEAMLQGEYRRPWPSSA